MPGEPEPVAGDDIDVAGAAREAKTVANHGADLPDALAKCQRRGKHHIAGLTSAHNLEPLHDLGRTEDVDTPLRCLDAGGGVEGRLAFPQRKTKGATIVGFLE
jgi:hypothetical protein